MRICLRRYRVTQDGLNIYYKELSKYEDKTIGTGGGFVQYDKDRLKETARFIADDISDKSVRIADIGCANGGLLKELKNLGFKNNNVIHAGSKITEILDENAVIVITSLIYEKEIKKGITTIFDEKNVPVCKILGFKKLLNN